MKHASDETLDHLFKLLTEIRRYSPPLKEKKRGVFYFKSSAFLHFHDDPAGIFADLKVDGDWVRYRINTDYEQTALIQNVQSGIGL